MKVSEGGRTFIRSHEGLRIKAYQCPAGVWTIGYGWTGKIAGQPIREGLVISKATAEALFDYGIAQFSQDVLALLKAPVTQGQFDALVSLAYNIGVSALGTSTLLKKLNAGDMRGAADEFPRWSRAGGKVLPGLVKRRAAEREWFLS